MSGSTPLILLIVAGGVCLLARPALAEPEPGSAPQWRRELSPTWRDENRPPQRPQPEAYCGASRLGDTPDVMSYDRVTGTQVLMSEGPGGVVDVTGVHQKTGSSFHVQGTLGKERVPYYCAADSETQDGYAIIPQGPGEAQVVGYDGATGRRWRVFDPNGATGPNYDTYDPGSERQASLDTGPDGKARSKTWNPASEHRCWAKLHVDATGEAGGSGGTRRLPDAEARGQVKSTGSLDCEFNF